MARVPQPNYWLSTERLALRRFRRADRSWLVELYGDADVTGMRLVGTVLAQVILVPASLWIAAAAECL
jgi:hypothetical protein